MKLRSIETTPNPNCMMLASVIVPDRAVSGSWVEPVLTSLTSAG